MSLLLSFPLPTKSHSVPKIPGLSKALLPFLDHVKVATKTAAQNQRRAIALPVFCSVGRNGSPVAAAKVVEEPEAPASVPASTVLGKSSFPPGFIFGVASSAYQVSHYYVHMHFFILGQFSKTDPFVILFIKNDPLVFSYQKRPNLGPLLGVTDPFVCVHRFQGRPVVILCL